MSTLKNYWHTMTSIRSHYEALGVSSFYEQNALTYSNPHENFIKDLLTEFISGFDRNLKILDLCCGSGEVTRILQNLGFSNICGLDPYTFELYKAKTSCPCFVFDFKDLSIGKFNESFDLVICSFALHLAPESMLPNILYNLKTEGLLILSPHKKPNIKDFFCIENNLYKNKIHLKYYKKRI